MVDNTLTPPKAPQASGLQALAARPDGAGLPAPAPLRDASAIPYRLRVGVTGHRDLPDDGALAQQVRHALQRVNQIAPASASTPLRLAVVSPLAEGADRLVARAVLELPGALLEAPLPLPRQDYEQDFATEASKHEFAELLARATRVLEMPPTETRPEAYAQVGQYVVDRCDVLIALWDGQPSHGEGGTAEIVEWARDRRVPLFWIGTAPPYQLKEELGDGIAATSFQRLDEYNRATVDAAAYARQMGWQSADLDGHAEKTGLDRDYLRAFCSWMLPHFVRVDLLAQRYQQRFFRFSDATFLLAAFAVAAAAGTAVAGQSPTVALGALPRLELLPLLELALMLAVLAIHFLGRRQGVHGRWISYRFLAEQLRSAMFLALAGVPDSPKNSAEHVSLKHPAEEWLQRALDEVWSQRPAPEPMQACESLKRFLVAGWIHDQLAYQRKKSHRHERRHRLLTGATVGIFVLTLLIAGLDAFGVGGHEGVGGLSRPTDLVYLSIALPALAGALGGIGAQREHLRNVHRSAQMARYLETIEKRMDGAPTLSDVHSVARQAEAVMLEENSDWFVAMEFHDFELHG